MLYAPLNKMLSPIYAAQQRKNLDNVFGAGKHGDAAADFVNAVNYNVPLSKSNPYHPYYDPKAPKDDPTPPSGIQPPAEQAATESTPETTSPAPKPSHRKSSKKHQKSKRIKVNQSKSHPAKSNPGDPAATQTSLAEAPGAKANVNPPNPDHQDMLLPKENEPVTAPETPNEPTLTPPNPDDPGITPADPLNNP